MKIIVLASKEVGYECLKHLLNQTYPISCIFCEEDDVAILELADKFNIPFSIFPDALEWLQGCKNLEFDWLINLWSSRLLSSVHLNKAKQKVNLHPSYVPFCLGSDTATWALLSKAPVGIALLDMNEKVDEGGVYLRVKLKDEYPTRAIDLQLRLKEESIKLFINNWQSLYADEIKSKKLECVESKFTRADTLNSQVKDIQDLNEGEKSLLDWILAHDFDENSQAGIKVDNKIIKINVSIENDREDE